MKSRPILFSGPMVRALLDGSKTQTRRPVKCNVDDYGSGILVTGKVCPYGEPKDTLWVRESLKAKEAFMVYAADDGRIDCGDMDWPACVEKRRSIPSIHMPRWASRITLEITDVRVERLQDISAKDCQAEGIWSQEGPLSDAEWIDAYRMLWQSINGPRSWAANPWVWVVEFKRVAQ